jgi:hypothetical protein
MTDNDENVSGLTPQGIMLCMDPLCVRVKQLASLTGALRNSIYLCL